MKGTKRVTVKVTWRAGNGERRCLQKEHRFVPGTPARVRKAWVERARAQLRKRIPAASDRAIVLGSLKADAPRYLAQMRHLADWGSQRSLVRAWFKDLGTRPRHSITREDVMRIRGEWKAAGVAHRTINNRVSVLRDLYRKLDGEDAPTPCDGVPFLKPPRTPIHRVSAAMVNTVLNNLLVLGLNPPRGPGKGRGRPGCHALQDRARLMVLVTTMKRPCELERAKPDDVSLDERVWSVRDAKGGHSAGVYLNDEALIAWRTFMAVDAWGPFPDHFALRMQRAGWPKGVRVYNVRHTGFILASEAGADLADIQAAAGHRHIATTRQHYVPVLNSRLQAIQERLDHRFGWSEGQHGCKGEAGTPVNTDV